MSLLAQRAQAWLAKNERAESLIVIGAWAGAYYGVHRLARAISNVAVPPSKDGAPGFLDAPQPKYSGCTLRKIVGARAASFAHAFVSFGWSCRALRASWWPALRAAAPRLAQRWPPFLGPALRDLLPLLAYDAPNLLPGARGVLRHSLGYFVQELWHVLRNEPDPIFVAHHLAYLLATGPILASDKGWAMIAVATVFAEVTNPIQLSWEMAKAFGLPDLYDALSLPFTAAFALCRGLLMPLAMVDIGLFLATRDQPDPTMKWAFGLFAVGIAASCVWLGQLVSGFRKYRRKKAAKK